MKNFLLIILIISCFFVACESHIATSEVPESVLVSFKEKYATATDVEWRKNKSDFEAEFKMKNEKNEKKVAYFTNEGIFIKEKDGLRYP